MTSYPLPPRPPTSTRPAPPPLPPQAGAAAPAGAPGSLFRPQRLAPHALDVTVNEHVRAMPPAMRDEVLERERTLAGRFDLWSPRAIRRVRHYVAGSLVALPLLHWLFSPIGFHCLWIQLPLAGLFGVVMGLFALRGAAAGCALLATGVLTHLLAGYRLGMGSVLILACYFVVGLALGVSESLSADERS